MIENSSQQGTESMTVESRRLEGPMAMCPMAKMCAGMAQTRFSSVLTTLPGILFIALGVLIVIEPGVLVWLLAAGSVLLGIMLLIGGAFLRKMGGQLRM